MRWLVIVQNKKIPNQLYSLFVKGRPVPNKVSFYAFFFVIKATRCTNFTNVFCNETLHVSDSSSVHHQEFIFVWNSIPSWSCSKAVYKPVWHIPLLSVQWINSWWWTDELSETCRVSLQNKFVKLVHLVGFVRKKFVTMYGHMNVKKILLCVLRLPVDGCVRQPKRVVAQYYEYVVFIVLCY